MTSEDADSGEQIRPSKVMSRTISGILWLIVAVSLLVVMQTGPATNKLAEKEVSSGPTQVNQFVKSKPFVIEQKGVKLAPRKVADFSLTERSGKTITNKDLLGKPWCVNFIFTSCAMTCPANTKSMMELSHACKDLDVEFVTITVDPERDTPERLKQYAEIYQADPKKWLFLTGKQQEIFDLIRNSFLQIVEERKGKSRLFGMEFAHSDRVMQIDANGMVVGQYLLTDPKEMVILRRVLEGKMEIPEENRFLVPENLPNPSISKNENPEEKSEAEEKTTSDETTVTPVDKKTEDKKNVAPDWLLRLPALNAILNGCALILLLVGYRLIRQGNREAHKKTMLLAFAVSVAFLGSYLTYHWGLHHYTGTSSRKFPEIGFLRQVYLSILFSHIILAALVPFLSVITIYLGLKGKWKKHRTLAQVTFPIWLYVSATGVIIYVMLYHIAGVG